MALKHIPVDPEPKDGARTLIMVHGFANTVLGISLLLWATPSAESLTNRYVPFWFWPFVFTLAGILAFIGLKSRRVAQFSFAFAGIAMLAFGIVSAWVVLWQHVLSAIPTTVFLLYLAYLKFMIASMVRETDAMVDVIKEATEKGKTALEKASDGTTS